LGHLAPSVSRVKVALSTIIIIIIIIINLSRNRDEMKAENMKTKKEIWDQVIEELQQ
jgi:hypothetical protein